MAVKGNYETGKEIDHTPASIMKGRTMNSLTQFKKIPILPVLIAIALVALASPTVARADAVTDWNAIASTAIVTNAGQPPPVSVLHFAMVQGVRKRGHTLSPPGLSRRDKGLLFFLWSVLAL
jgi:hypothetical protein